MSKSSHDSAPTAVGFNLDQAEQSASKPIDPFSPEELAAQAGTIDSAAQSEPRKPVKVFLVDVGHVLVDFNWKEVRKGFCDLLSVTDEQLTPVLAYMGSQGYERGALTTVELLKAVESKYGYQVSLDDFRRIWNTSFIENPAVAAVLAQTKEQRLQVMASNNNEVHYAHLEGTYQISRLFHALVLSHCVGFAKPNADFYEKAMQVAREHSKDESLKPEDFVLIDDLQPNIDGAAKLGIQTIKFVGVEPLKAALAEFGIQVS